MSRHKIIDPTTISSMCHRIIYFFRKKIIANVNDLCSKIINFVV